MKMMKLTKIDGPLFINPKYFTSSFRDDQGFNHVTLLGNKFIVVEKPEEVARLWEESMKERSE